MIGLWLGMVVLACGCSKAGGADTASTDQAVQIGDAVFAEWTPESWYHGKVTKTCKDGMFVKFDDGDAKCTPLSKLAKDVVLTKGKVKKGTAILARWSDGRYYTAKVSEVTGDRVKLEYYDGTKDEVPLSDVRLR